MFSLCLDLVTPPVVKTFQNSVTKTIFNKTTYFEYFFVILQRVIYKKLMTVSALISANACKKNNSLKVDKNAQ